MTGENVRKRTQQIRRKRRSGMLGHPSGRHSRILGGPPVDPKSLEYLRLLADQMTPIEPVTPPPPQCLEIIGWLEILE